MVRNLKSENAPAQDLAVAVKELKVRKKALETKVFIIVEILLLVVIISIVYNLGYTMYYYLIESSVILSNGPLFSMNGDRGDKPLFSVADQANFSKDCFVFLQLPA